MAFPQYNSLKKNFMYLNAKISRTLLAELEDCTKMQIRNFFKDLLIYISCIELARFASLLFCEKCDNDKQTPINYVRFFSFGDLC